MTLGLCMIVKNEEHCIKRCLDSVSNVFDEIILVDTGSTDKTVEIAKKFNCKIEHFKWIDDFAAARNYSFSKSSTDYLMWLDADDEILPNDKLKLLELKAHLDADAYLMAYNYAHDEFDNCSVRIFRHRIIKRGIATWQHPIHECMMFKPNCREFTTDISITHRRGVIDIAKDVGRNLAILKKAVVANPTDQRLKFYCAKELGDAGKLEESIKWFKEYYKGSDWIENMVNGRFYMATYLWQLGKESDAIDSCIEGIKLDANRAEFYVTIGQIFYNRTEWSKAIPWFELAIKCTLPDTAGTVIIDNYTWTPRLQLSLCLNHLGRVKEAYEANEAAIIAFLGKL